MRQRLVDFVGRFETLVTDFDFICQRICIPAELPHLNRSAHRDYLTYYNPCSAEMIAKRYERYIALFRYSLLVDATVPACSRIPQSPRLKFRQRRRVIFGRL